MLARHHHGAWGGDGCHFAQEAATASFSRSDSGPRYRAVALDDCPGAGVTESVEDRPLQAGHVMKGHALTRAEHDRRGIEDPGDPVARAVGPRRRPVVREVDWAAAVDRDERLLSVDEVQAVT